MTTANRKASVKATILASASTQAPILDGAEDESAADLDRILGDGALHAQ